ncbi:MAG: stalk domain-containing protein [Caldisericia bacterium]
MAFGNVEIKRIFCHMLYYVMGSGWLQQKESPLNVRAINGDGKVLLKWEPPEESDSCYGYRVYRQKNGGEWVQIHDFPLIDGETEWLDTTVDNGENYVYKVCCVTATDYNVACSYHAKAQPSKPVLSVDPNLPKPGETVEVVGSEYTVKGTATPGSKVVIKWKLKPSGISGEVEVIADENGNYEAKIPLTPGQTVEYTITVENELGDSETIGPFFVKCIQEEIIMLFTIGSKTAYVNGIEWPTQLDAAPFIVESSNRTVVPFRFIGERIGATLDYSPKDAAVEKVWYEIDSAVEGHVLVEVWINKTTAKKNGIAVEMDQAPLIRNGRTVVPIRFVAENLGAKVEWFADTRQVKITYPNPD